MLDVLEGGVRVNKSANLLHYAPQSVLLMECLAILSASAPDPSLLIGGKTKSDYKKLQNPHSFRASLYQVSTSMSNAYQTSHGCMYKIRVAMKDLPVYMEETIKTLMQVKSNRRKL